MEEDKMQQFRSRATELLLREEWKEFPEARFRPLDFAQALQDCEESLKIESTHFKTTRNVVSSIQGISARETEEIWNKLYPAEPYEFDSTSAFSHTLSNDEVIGAAKCTDYDLIKAIERQSPFFYQHKEDVNKVLAGSPWSVMGYTTVLVKWDVKIPISEVSFDYCNFWLQILNLPVGKRSEANKEWNNKLTGEDEASGHNRNKEIGEIPRLIQLAMQGNQSSGTEIMHSKGAEAGTSFSDEERENGTRGSTNLASQKVLNEVISHAPLVRESLCFNNQDNLGLEPSIVSPCFSKSQEKPIGLCPISPIYYVKEPSEGDNPYSNEENNGVDRIQVNLGSPVDPSFLLHRDPNPWNRDLSLALKFKDLSIKKRKRTVEERDRYEGKVRRLSINRETNTEDRFFNVVLPSIGKSNIQVGGFLKGNESKIGGKCRKWKRDARRRESIGENQVVNFELSRSDANDSCSLFACLLIDKNCSLVDGYVKKVKAASALVAEALAVREACNLAEIRDLSNLIIGSDSQMVISLLTSNSDPHWEINVMAGYAMDYGELISCRFSQ
ncbi:hypothetical protein LguiB_003036 [Lonicera macranthoides]